MRLIQRNLLGLRYSNQKRYESASAYVQDTSARIIGENTRDEEFGEGDECSLGEPSLIPVQREVY